MSHKYIDCKVNVFQFQGVLQPGDYTMPFEFDLPLNIPGSVIWKRPDIYEQPDIEIKYTIKVILKTKDKHILKYKHLLLIREPPINFLQNPTTEKQFHMKACGSCLCGNGCLLASGQGHTNLVL